MNEKYGGERPENAGAAPLPAFEAGARPHWAYREIAVLPVVAALSLLAAGRTALYFYMRAAGDSDLPSAVEGMQGNPYWALAVQSTAWIPVLLYIYWVVVRRCGRRFAAGVGWLPPAHPAKRYLAGGVLLAASVMLLAAVVGVPDESYPLLELFRYPGALWLLAAFGVLVAPVVEEIVFRGFLFAALEHVHGAGFALIATSAAFSLVHGAQYGWQWQNLSILFWVGLALGAVRIRTGSTQAAALAHASYNGLLFAVLLAAPEQLR